MRLDQCLQQQLHCFCTNHTTFFSCPVFLKFTFISFILFFILFLLVKGGDAVKIAQLANIAGSQNRISQPETPVTLQFQGNKFTLSPSQLRQLTTGQPLQLQGILLNIIYPQISFLNFLICAGPLLFLFPKLCAKIHSCSVLTV